MKKYWTQAQAHCVTPCRFVIDVPKVATPTYWCTLCLFSDAYYSRLFSKNEKTRTLKAWDTSSSTCLIPCRFLIVVPKVAAPLPIDALLPLIVVCAPPCRTPINWFSPQVVMFAISRITLYGRTNLENDGLALILCLLSYFNVEMAYMIFARKNEVDLTQHR